MLVDSGPLVGLLDVNDQYHDACTRAVQSLPREPFLTTWLCFTEAMYFLGSEGGYRYQRRLWQMRRDGLFILLDLTTADADRMDVLMERYQNVPMDTADASLVVAAESLGLRRLFTIDSDFTIYRLADGSALEIVR